jgi:hypothetical protein
MLVDVTNIRNKVRMSNNQIYLKYMQILLKSLIMWDAINSQYPNGETFKKVQNAFIER